MNSNPKVVEVSAGNLADHPQVICFINPKHESYHRKIDWLKEQFKGGLKIKLLYLEEEKRPVGFIEYVPGENCRRPVDAKGYMFVHCLWTNGKKHQHRGLGSRLLEEVEADAKNMSAQCPRRCNPSLWKTRSATRIWTSSLRCNLKAAAAGQKTGRPAPAWARLFSVRKASSIIESRPFTE